MASYIMLINFTEQGVHHVKNSPKRASAAVALGKKMGVKVTDEFWTLGVYDGVLVAEAPNDETMTAFALSISARGNVQTQTLRAMRAKEFSAVLRKMK